MGSLAWILFFALAAILDPASCCHSTQKMSQSIPPEPPSPATSPALRGKSLHPLLTSREIPLAAAVSIIGLALLAALRSHPPKAVGAGEVAQVAGDVDKFGSWERKLMQEDEAGGPDDTERLWEWKTKALRLVRAVERNRPKSAEKLEVALQEGIPLVLQALARAEDPGVPDATKEQLKKAVEAAMSMLKRASKRLTGLWITRAEEARAKVEKNLQAVRDGVKNLLPGALVGAKDELMLQLKRLKRIIEGAIPVHKMLKQFAEHPMPGTGLFKKVQELEYVLQDASTLLLSTLRDFQKEWEDKAQALRQIIAEGGPDAANAKEQLKLIEKRMVAALRKIQKLSQISSDDDEDESDGFMPK